ncbi:DUF4124 domain-containing protein [Cupriavidus pampae]|uniref:DUF4124 domain-containing protein n=1 Tax=Cupriavidus pampae TaxID=659251 RepID=A0ABM8XK13_9BURK|nr:DUF4124 domain-containing protein [Cupriavidus pampae]CAG9180526.1 hypothetical protein LMG32289_04642 [Cupriavidus pampae]
MTRSFAPFLLATALIAAVPGAALAAQWQWRDEAGRKVYSDTPPPPSVPERNILSAPGRVAGAYVPTNSETAEGKSAGSVSTIATTPTDSQAALQAQKEGFEKRRAARLKQEEDAAAKDAKQAQRTARCQELSNYAAGLSQNARIARINSEGMREALDDAQRAAALERTNTTMAAECNGTNG